MKKKQITIKDIATQLNISPSAVSRALKDHYSIGEETKKAVRELAAKLNYKPNLAAISLVNKRSNTIGVVLPEITTHFFSSIISGIEEVCVANNYNVFFCQSNESLEKEKAVCQALFASNIDGLLISLSKETSNQEHILKIISQGVPVIFIDRIAESVETESVAVDDFNAAYSAVEYLISNGCKRIAHISATSFLSNAIKRKEGYIAALKNNNLLIDENLILEGRLESEEIKNITAQLLSSPYPPDAIFAFNDYVAFDVLQVAKSIGLRIPQDLQILGFGNDPIASYVSPTLTTVAQPSLELGKSGASLLINKINSMEKKTKFENIVLKTQLIIRESTGGTMTE